MKQIANLDLTNRNTFRMKVRCALFVEVEREEELKRLDWDALPRPVMVMGGGSNLLFTRDFPGTILHYGEISPLASLGRNDKNLFISSESKGEAGKSYVLVTVPAGTVFDDFCAWAAAEGLWGPENLSLIPGEAGASAVQNIGAYGVEAKDIIAGIRAWDRQEKRFVEIDPAQCAYGYRTSRFKTGWKSRYIITAVTFRLSREPQPILDYGGIRKALEMAGSTGNLTPQLIRNVIIGIRNSKLPDPAKIGSAGSFFCNPVVSREHFERIVEIARQDNGPDCQVPHYDTPDGVKVPAAWMIEQCGFKGVRNGGAQVYPGQPLVIVNASGTASPEDIIGLEQQIIDTIAGKYGITLYPEVEHV